MALGANHRHQKGKTVDLQSKINKAAKDAQTDEDESKMQAANCKKKAKAANVQADNP